MKYEILLKSEEDTFKLSKLMLPIVQSGRILGLSGDLGSGKTAFVRYLLQSLGNKEKVSSPTFVLENRYKLNECLTISHWDLYRLSYLPEEFIEQTKSGEFRIVEWSDKFPELNLDYSINFIIDGEEQRKVLLSESLKFIISKWV